MALIASLIMLVLLAAPGVRLLTAAAREQRVPEFWCGLFFVSVAVGMSGRFFAVGHRFSDPDGVMLIDNASHVAFTIGLCALVMFILRVFRPDDGAARMAGTAIMLGSLVATAYAVWERATIGEQAYTIIAMNTFRTLPLLWAFVESVRYWQNMKRRAALGLADPVVLNRFLLWAIWTGGVSIIPILALGLRISILAIYGEEGLENGEIAAILPKVLTVMRALIIVILPAVAGALWLSFFPPQRYLDRVRAQAEAVANPTG